MQVLYKNVFMNSTFESKATTQNVSNIIQNVENSDNNINLNPTYQRGGKVWSDKRKSEFIISIFKGIIPSQFIFNLTDEGTNICIDGKQRILAMCGFKNNEFPFIHEIDDNNLEYVFFNKVNNATEEMKDKTRILTKQEKIQFNQTQTNTITYNQLSYNDQCDIFKRINNGESVNKDELLISKLHEKEGKLFKEFAEKCAHLFKKTNINRMKHTSLLTVLFVIFNEKELVIKSAIMTDKLLNDYLGKKDAKKKLNKMYNILKIIYSNDLLNHKDIKKIPPKNILINLLYNLMFIHEKVSKLDDNGFKQLRKGINYITENFKKDNTSINPNSAGKKIVEHMQQYIQDKLEEYLNNVKQSNKQSNKHDESFDNSSADNNSLVEESDNENKSKSVSASSFGDNNSEESDVANNSEESDVANNSEEELDEDDADASMQEFYMKKVKKDDGKGLTLKTIHGKKFKPWFNEKGYKDCPTTSQLKDFLIEKGFDYDEEKQKFAGIKILK